MISFLTGLPLWLSGMLIVGLPTVLAMFGPILVRRYVTLEKLEKNNEVAGFKFAVVGVLYAVLLGFAIIVVWQRFSDAENNVAREAAAAATIYRLSQGINGQPGIALRGALTNYLRAAISDGWPAMERGSPSTSAREALDGVYKALLTFESAERRGAPSPSTKSEPLKAARETFWSARTRIWRRIVSAASGGAAAAKNAPDFVGNHTRVTDI